MLEVLVLRQRNRQDKQENNTKEIKMKQSKRPVELAVGLLAETFHRQRKAEKRGVTIYRPKRSDRANERTYNKLGAKLQSKFLNKWSVSDTRSLTSRTEVNLDENKCASGRANKRYQNNFNLSGKEKKNRPWRRCSQAWGLG